MKRFIKQCGGADQHLARMRVEIVPRPQGDGKAAYDTHFWIDGVKYETRKKAVLALGLGERGAAPQETQERRLLARVEHRAQHALAGPNAAPRCCQRPLRDDAPPSWADKAGETPRQQLPCPGWDGGRGGRGASPPALLWTGGFWGLGTSRTQRCPRQRHQRSTTASTPPTPPPPTTPAAPLAEPSPSGSPRTAAAPSPRTAAASSAFKSEPAAATMAAAAPPQPQPPPSQRAAATAPKAEARPDVRSKVLRPVSSAAAAACC
jgi:hypothetical protein